MANIQNYASKIGTEYLRIDGKPMGGDLCPEIQKAYIYHNDLDQYDFVLGLDCDIFSRTDDNVFDVDGMGLHHPELPVPGKAFRAGIAIDKSYPYFNGGFLKVGRDLRRSLREHLTRDLLRRCDSREVGGIEMLTYALCVSAGFRPSPIDPIWNQYSHLPNPERAKMIHIRRKRTDGLSQLEDFRRAGILS